MEWTHVLLDVSDLGTIDMLLVGSVDVVMTQEQFRNIGLNCRKVDASGSFECRWINVLDDVK